MGCSPLKVVDQLRLEVRRGMAVASTLRLIIQFVEDFADTLAAVIAGQSDLVDHAEDKILKDRFLRETGELGEAGVCWLSYAGMLTPSEVPWRNRRSPVSLDPKRYLRPPARHRTSRPRRPGLGVRSRAS
jgi:hypothetical protein